MATTRTPIKPNSRTRITNAALDAFARMLELKARCSCPPYVHPEPFQECASCDEWWVEHLIVWRETRCHLHEWPAVQRPGTVDRPDRAAQERWRELEAALAERER